MPNRTPRLYLALIFLAMIGLALLVAERGHRLPYGSWTKVAFAMVLLVAMVPAAFFVRSHIFARTLVTAELLRMDPLDLPRRDEHTFMGFAYLWKPRHAERLYHMMARGVEAPEEVQALFGGNTLIHGLGQTEERPLFVADKKRTHHTIILGSPGEGKTRAIELAVRQLIEKDDVVVILDPKGDERLINLVQQVCEETGRGSQFRLVALPWPKKSCAYNPLSRFSTPGDIADRVMGVFPQAVGDAQTFRAFQWGATAAVVQALYLLGLPITFARLLHYVGDLNHMGELAVALIRRHFPNFDAPDLKGMHERYEEAVRKDSKKSAPELEDLFRNLQHPPEYYSKMIGTLLPLLQQLSAGPKRELLSPEPKETDREILTWPAVSNQKLVVYFYLGSMQGEDSANAVGKMILLDFQAYIAGRYAAGAQSADESESRRISLFVDEAHHMVSKPFLNILAEGRGANIACVLSTQTTAQFEQVLQSKAAVDEILTQHFWHIQFQSRNPREAEDFSKLAGERQMRVVGEAHRYEPGFFSSGEEQVDDFVAQYTLSLQYKDTPLVPAWAIAQLPTFHFFARCAGRIYKGRIPLLTEPTSNFTRDLLLEARAA